MSLAFEDLSQPASTQPASSAPVSAPPPVLAALMPTDEASAGRTRPVARAFWAIVRRLPRIALNLLLAALIGLILFASWAPAYIKPSIGQQNRVEQRERRQGGWRIWGRRPPPSPPRSQMHSPLKTASLPSLDQS